MEEKTFVIAEAGANHNRDFEQAMALIDVAKESGANACKFQLYTSDGLFAKQDRPINGISDIHSMFKQIETPREWVSELKSYSDEVGIEFMATPFDESAVQQLVDVGVNRIKVAGFESSDFRFVEMVASTKLPLIVSLGIGFPTHRLGEFLDICFKYNDDLTILHCNNAYPTPMSDIDLTQIDSLIKAGRGAQVGLSDHTLSTLTPALAVAKGATTIEKHFTLSNKLSGPDHSFALEPHQLKEMVSLIRQTELTLIKHDTNYTNSEEVFKNGKRSVVAKCDIKAGDVITTNNITTKRPCYDDSIPAIDYSSILGKVAMSDISSDNIIKKSQISNYE